MGEAGAEGIVYRKSEAVRLNNRHQTKQIQQLIDAEITKAKAEYQEEILAHMSSNIKTAWQGIKNSRR